MATTTFTIGAGTIAAGLIGAAAGSAATAGIGLFAAAVGGRRGGRRRGGRRRYYGGRRFGRQAGNLEDIQAMEKEELKDLLKMLDMSQDMDGNGCAFNLVSLLSRRTKQDLTESERDILGFLDHYKEGEGLLPNSRGADYFVAAMDGLQEQKSTCPLTGAQLEGLFLSAATSAAAQ